MLQRNAQRFGVPMGFGGPHAAFFATTENLNEKFLEELLAYPKIQMVIKRFAWHYKLENNTLEEKATSNICTAQVLLAIISSMYAVYHGPKGLKRIGNESTC